MSIAIGHQNKDKTLKLKYIVKKLSNTYHQICWRCLKWCIEFYGQDRNSRLIQGYVMSIQKFYISIKALLKCFKEK
jgi:hypothetical protein